ncbi:MAG: hypothetical protein WBO36_14625 [Saprospiraceae bacterium]
MQYPDELLGFIPSFRSIFVSLFALTDDHLMNLKNGMLRSAMLVQRHRFDPVLLGEDFVRILSSLDPYISKNFINTLIVYTLQVAELKDDDFKKIIDDIPTKIKSALMSTYDIITKRGIEKGIEQGIEKGIEKGVEKGIAQKEIDVIIKGHANGLDIQMLANITGRSTKEILNILSKK